MDTAQWIAVFLAALGSPLLIRLLENFLNKSREDRKSQVDTDQTAVETTIAVLKEVREELVREREEARETVRAFSRLRDQLEQASRMIHQHREWDTDAVHPQGAPMPPLPVLSWWDLSAPDE